MAQNRSLQNITVIAPDHSIVWSDDSPASAWMTSENDGLKVPLASDCPHSHCRDPPPKYDHQDITPRKINASSTRHATCYRESIKFLAIAVYLFLLYKISTASFQPNFLSINWPSDLMRAHSRDFISLNDFNDAERDDAWSQSRLGRLASDSPFLTSSEMDLFIELEWDPEPNTDSYELDEGNDSEPLDVETIFTHKSKSQQNLPMPLHKPSNLLKLTRNLFNEINRLPLDS